MNVNAPAPKALLAPISLSSQNLVAVFGVEPKTEGYEASTHTRSTAIKP